MANDFNSAKRLVAIPAAALRRGHEFQFQATHDDGELYTAGPFIVEAIIRGTTEVQVAACYDYDRKNLRSQLDLDFGSEPITFRFPPDFPLELLAYFTPVGEN